GSGCALTALDSKSPPLFRRGRPWTRGGELSSATTRDSSRRNSALRAHLVRPWPPLFESSELHRVEGLFQVADDVGGVFGADREADEVGRDAGRFLLFDRELLVRRGRGVDDQRLAVSHVRQVREKLDVVDQLAAVFALLRVGRSLDAEAEDRAAAVRE